MLKEVLQNKNKQKSIQTSNDLSVEYHWLYQDHKQTWRGAWLEQS